MNDKGREYNGFRRSPCKVWLCCLCHAFPTGKWLDRLLFPMNLSWYWRVVPCFVPQRIPRFWASMDHHFGFIRRPRRESKTPWKARCTISWRDPRDGNVSFITFPCKYDGLVLSPNFVSCFLCHPRSLNRVGSLAFVLQIEWRPMKWEKVPPRLVRLFSGGSNIGFQSR